MLWCSFSLCRSEHDMRAGRVPFWKRFLPTDHRAPDVFNVPIFCRLQNYTQCDQWTKHSKVCGYSCPRVRKGPGLQRWGGMEESESWHLNLSISLNQPRCERQFELMPYVCRHPFHKSKVYLVCAAAQWEIGPHERLLAGMPKLWHLGSLMPSYHIVTCTRCSFETVASHKCG